MIKINSNKFGKQKEKYKIIVISILLIICSILTYYFHIELKTETVFSHFFYIPIILSALWWKRKGLLMAIFLSGLLLFSHEVLREDVMGIDDYMRAVMFIVAGFVVAILSEKISRAESGLEHINRVLHAIRKVNRLIAKEKDTDRLLRGVCENLIETRGFHYAWIVLLNKKEIIKTAEVRLGKNFQTLSDRLKQGNLPSCGKRALSKPGVVVTEEPASDSACAGCPLADRCIDRGAMTVRLEHGRDIYGIIGVSVPKNFISDAEEQSLIKEMADDIALALHGIGMEKEREERTLVLQKRIKELNCLLNISRIVENPAIALTEIFQEVVDIIPAAWQYPEITCARVIVEDNEFSCANFHETVWKQAVDLIVHEKKIGAVEVYYFEERPEEYEGPFLKEERKLIVAVTGLLGRIIERIRAEEEIVRLNEELEQRIRERTVELENANRELKEFAYIVSHDLKAPLRGISKLASWISDDYSDSFDENGKEQISLLIGRVKRMDNLIDGILQYSRVGQVKGNKEVVELNELIGDVIDKITPPENINVVIVNDLPEIEIDRIRIEQVFQNLLDNAIKFMDKTTGEIRVGYTDDGLRFKFYVSDNGPGIDVKYYEKIFQIFQTLTPRDERESTGIGLSLVKKIVESYNGKIWLESETGKGSTFFFTLPKYGA